VRTPVFNPNDFQVTVKIPEIQVVGEISQRDPDVLSRYLGRVKSLIEREWRRFQASANLRGTGALVVEAKVEFRISTGGYLRSSRLARPSSYSEFDQLVLRAVRSVGKVEPPPFVIDSPLSMTFRLN